MTTRQRERKSAQRRFHNAGGRPLTITRAEGATQRVARSTPTPTFSKLEIGMLAYSMTVLLAVIVACAVVMVIHFTAPAA